jgi:iron-sulfur cluster repair protein YtfE (RIC family)
MDPFQLLHRDHEQARSMFRRLLDEHPSDERSASLFQQLKEALEIHTTIEEDIFYPPLHGAAETHGLIEDGLNEHAEAKQMLQRLSGMSAGSDEWYAALRELYETIEHHVHDEEEKLFPAARRLFSGQHSDEIGNALDTEKTTLLRH